MGSASQREYFLIWAIWVCVGSKGRVFISAVSVINRLSLLAILVLNRVWF